MEISHEEFIAILKEKDKHEKSKDNLRSEMKNMKLWDWVVWNQRLTKIKNKKYSSKRFVCVCVCIKWL